MSRTTQRVDLPSAPDLVVFVGALSALEAIELSARLREKEKTQDIIAEQLRSFVCNEDGSPRFIEADAALDFMRTIRPGQMKKIISTATTLNELNDEAIEEERKN